MGETKSNKISGRDASGETRLRDGVLNKDQRDSDVERLARQQSQNTDQVLRTDGEEDTLYDDGLELDDKSDPLKGINGRDDT